MITKYNPLQSNYFEMISCYFSYKLTDDYNLM